MKNNKPKNNQDQLKEALQKRANENLPDLWGRIEARLPEAAVTESAKKHISFGFWAKRLSATAAVVLAVIVGVSVYRSNNVKHYSSDTTKDEVTDSRIESTPNGQTSTLPNRHENVINKNDSTVESDKPAQEHNFIELLPGYSHKDTESNDSSTGPGNESITSDVHFLFEYRDTDGRIQKYNSFEHTHEIYEGDCMTDTGWSADIDCIEKMIALLDEQKVWETESIEGSNMRFLKTEENEDVQTENALWTPSDSNSVGFHLYLVNGDKILNLYAVGSQFASDSISNMIFNLYDGLRKACEES